MNPSQLRARTFWSSGASTATAAKWQKDSGRVASTDVVVSHMVAAPNVGKRASKSPCRWRHDLANHRSPMAHTCTPPTKTSMILGRSLLRAEGVGMSSLTAGRNAGARTPKSGRMWCGGTTASCGTCCTPSTCDDYPKTVIGPQPDGCGGLIYGGQCCRRLSASFAKAPWG
jgi:hypothetical protein